MLTLILKTTNGCNLRCKYCSLGSKEDSVQMDSSMMISSLRYIGELCRKRNESELFVILHGGEPTTVPAKCYDTAFSFFSAEYQEIRTHYMIQTNGFYFSDDTLRLLKKWNIGIGVSIDGSKETHDSMRVDYNNRSTYDRITSNILMLKKEGFEPSCLMVVTKACLNKGFDFLKFFDNNNLPLKINPMLMYGEAEKNGVPALERGEYSDYLIKMYEYIIDKGLSIAVSPLDKFLYSSLFKKNIAECTFSNTCTKNFISIDPYGRLFPCGKLADSQALCLGTINDNPLLLDDNTVFKALCSRRNENPPSKCKDCKYLNKCNAGCSAEAFISGDLNAETGLCSDYIKLFRYFEKQGLLKIKTQLQNRRNQIINGIRNYEI